MTLNDYALIIDGEPVYGQNVSDVTWLPLMREAYSKREWYLCENTDAAERAVYNYWQDIARNDPQEFIAIFGEECIVEWWLAKRSFDDIMSEIDATEVFATYDGYECSVDSMTEYVEKHYANIDFWEALDPEGTGMITETEQEDETLEEIRLLLVGWQNLCDELGFEPEIAYRAN